MNPLVPLVLALAFAPPVPGAPGAASPAQEARADGSGSERLLGIARELEAALAGHDPRRARALGAKAEPNPLAADPAWWTRFLRSRMQALESTWSGSLRPVERSLRDAIEDRVRAELVLATALPLRRWDPVLHVELATATLQDALEAPPIERPQGLERAAEILARARDLLMFPRAEWTAEALERLAELRAQLDPDEPGMAAVVQACAELEAWLEEARGEGGELLPRLGRESWGALAQAATGTRRSTRELRVALLRELGRLDNAIGDAPRPEAPAPEALDAAAERAAGTALFARNEARAPDLLPPIDLAVEVAVEPGPRHAAGLCAFRRDGGTVRLRFTAPAEGWPESLAEDVLRSLDAAALGAEVVRLGMPGEGALLLLGGEHASAGPLTWGRGGLEGWGVYALDWLTRHPEASASLGRKAPSLAVELRRAHLRQVALCLASLEWHALELSAGSVVDGLRLRTGMAAELARLEVARIAHDPLVGIGALGALECLELERAVARELHAPDPIRATLRLLLTQPELRPGDLLRHGLLGAGG